VRLGKVNYVIDTLLGPLARRFDTKYLPRLKWRYRSDLVLGSGLIAFRNKIPTYPYVQDGVVWVIGEERNIEGTQILVLNLIPTV